MIPSQIGARKTHQKGPGFATNGCELVAGVGEGIRTFPTSRWLRNGLPHYRPYGPNPCKYNPELSEMSISIVLAECSDMSDTSNSFNRNAFGGVTDSLHIIWKSLFLKQVGTVGFC